MSVSHPVRGSVLVPGAERWHRREGETYVKINSDGMRDREHQLRKPPGTVRVAVLGDSFGQANSVDVRDTFWSLQEEILFDCAAFKGLQVEILNFSVSGYGTAQELLAFRHHARKYNPDVVLLAVFTGNDVRNNSRELEGGERPYFVWQAEKLVLDRSSQLDSSGAMMHASKLFLARRIRTVGLIQQIHRWQAPKPWRTDQATAASGGPIGLFNADAASLVGSEPGLDAGVYLPPKDPVWRDAWRVTEGLLVMLREEVETAGAALRVVTLSNAVQVHPDPKVRARFAKSLGVADLYYPDDRLREFAQRESIEILNLAPHLAEMAEQRNVFFHGFENTAMGIGHWNQDGHRAAAEFIAPWLCGTMTNWQQDVSHGPKRVTGD